MKFLKVNVNHRRIIDDFKNKYPDFERFNYKKLEKKFYTQAYWPSYNALENSLNKKYKWEHSSIFYSSDDSFNDILFQKWCKNKGIKSSKKLAKEYKLLKQIIYYRPQIIYFTEIFSISKELFEKIRFLLKDVIIIGWNGYAATFMCENLYNIDKIFTCFEPTKNRCLVNGINSTNVGHFFDQKISKTVKGLKQKYEVVFVGSVKAIAYCNKREKFLEKLISRNINITIFGKSDSKILKPYLQTPVYGLEYYKTLKSAKIVLNIHAGNSYIEYSGNIRAYETTGVGSLLLTDYKEDLNSKFLIDKEVVAYKDVDEAVEKIEYYLKHDSKREAIAKAGQERTLRNYGYDKFAKAIYDEVMYIKNNKKEYQDRCFENILRQKDDKRLLFKDMSNSLIKQTKEIVEIYEKIALYGNGNIANLIKEHIPNLVVIADRQNPKNSKNICHPDDLNDYEFDAIIVTVFGQDEYIVNYLVNELQIPKNKIILFELN